MAGDSYIYILLALPLSSKAKICAIYIKQEQRSMTCTIRSNKTWINSGYGYELAKSYLIQNGHKDKQNSNQLRSLIKVNLELWKQRRQRTHF